MTKNPSQPAIREALIELVALKDLMESALDFGWTNLNARDEYQRRRPPAWAAARTALAAQPEASEPVRAAAEALLNAIDKGLDEKPWPQKYGVPYGEVNALASTPQLLPPDPGVAWAYASKLAEVPEVDEALASLVADATADHGVEVVLAVLRAVQC